MMDEPDKYNTKQQGWHKELEALQQIIQSNMLEKAGRQLLGISR